MASQDAQFLAAFAKGRDIEFFAKEILGVELNPAQLRWVHTALRLKNGWDWVFKRSAHVAANQIGKTLGLAIVAIWANNYKIGIKNDNWDAWLASAYNHFHIAPTYTQSLLLLADMRMLMQGNHPAQFDKSTGQFRRSLWSDGLWTERKIDATYNAIEFWNGSIIHFRTSSDKAKSLQGVRAHIISFDEAAFEDHLIHVIDQAVKLRLISTGGPLLMVSTPNGINDYYQIVQDFISRSVKTDEHVWESEEQQVCVVWSTIDDNVGYGFTQEEVDFLEKDIDPATKDQQLRGAFLEPQDAFFVPVSDIEAAFIPMAAEQDPKNDHRYVAFWDVSIASDPTVCVVLDVTKEKFTGVYYRRYEKPLPFRELLSEIRRVHWFFSTPDHSRIGRAPMCITGFDASSMGGVAVRQELEDVNNLRPLVMSGSSRMKQEFLINLRKALSTKKLVLPQKWTRARTEILSYREKDDKLQQDSVMALAGAIKVASASNFGAPRPVPFSVNNRLPRRWAGR